LPVLCLCLAAVPGALLVNRFDARVVVGGGVLGLAGGAAARALPPPLLALFAGTLLLGVSVAVAQPAAAVIIRSWFPDRVQRASTLYALSLNLGGLAGAAVTGYLLALGGWRGTFVLWALPALAVAGFWFLAAPRPPARETEPHGLRALSRDRGVWRAAGLFGCQSIAYFTAATWIPFLLRSYGHGYISIVLLLMNLTLLPVGAVLALVRRQYATAGAFYAAGGLLTMAGALGFALGFADQAFLLAVLVGAGTGLTFTGAMGLPSLVARTEAEASGYSALMLTGGYALSFPAPFLGGFLLDHTGSLTSPFWPVVIAAVAIVVLGLTMRPAVAAR
jgi:CP family cyanate transporter-like MFS transporter